MSAAEQMTVGFCMLAGVMTACTPLMIVEIIRQRRIAAEIRQLNASFVLGRRS